MNLLIAIYVCLHLVLPVTVGWLQTLPQSLAWRCTTNARLDDGDRLLGVRSLPRRTDRLVPSPKLTAESHSHRSFSYFLIVSGVADYSRRRAVVNRELGYLESSD